MANNTKAIKNRIKSIKNTSKVTRSMEKISAVKRVKYSNLALASKKYSFEIDSTSNLFAKRIKITEDSPAVLKPVDSPSHLLVVLASDRGLCGAFNSNIITVANNYIKSKLEESPNSSFKLLALGKRGAKISTLNTTVELIGLYEKIYENPTFEKAVEILDGIIDGYTLSQYSSVTLIYTAYQSTTSQNISISKLLPFNVNLDDDDFQVSENDMVDDATEESVDAKVQDADHDLEPSADDIQEYILKKSLETKLYQAILDSSASEHTSRMIAMKNASDNASDLDYALNLAYNKGRQAAVTQEISEIVSGIEALKDFN